MAIDPALPASIFDEIRDLKRRLAALERSPKLTTASVTGRLRVVDDAGNEVVVLGALEPGVEKGITVRETTTGGSNLMFAVGGFGFHRPWLHTAWRTPAASASVTSGTFVTVFTSQTELVSSVACLFRVLVNVPVGTTGEFRLVAGASSTSTKTVVGTGVPGYIECRWQHGVALNAGPVSFNLQVRRSAGAGTITVFEPGDLAHGLINASTSAGWV